MHYFQQVPLCLVEHGPMPTSRTQRAAFIESGTTHYFCKDDKKRVAEKDFSIVIAWDGENVYTPTRGMAVKKQEQSRMRLLAHHLNEAKHLIDSFDKTIDEGEMLTSLSETVTGLQAAFKIRAEEIFFSDQRSSRRGTKPATKPKPSASEGRAPRTVDEDDGDQTVSGFADPACVCEKCGKVFSSVKEVLFHKYKAHEMGNSFICKRCNPHRDFTNKYHLRDHLNSHDKKYLHSCGYDECQGWGTNSKQLYETHMMRKHQIGKKWFCKKKLPNGKKCEKSFDGENHLVRHQKLCGVEKSLKCPDKKCSQMFKSKANLDTHVEIYHSESAKFACHQCGKKLGSKKTLDSHYRRHELTHEELDDSELREAEAEEED